MKRFLLIIASAALLFTSCTKENFVNTFQSKLQPAQTPTSSNQPGLVVYSQTLKGVYPDAGKIVFPQFNPLKGQYLSGHLETKIYLSVKYTIKNLENVQKNVTVGFTREDTTYATVVNDPTHYFPSTIYSDEPYSFVLPARGSYKLNEVVFNTTYDQFPITSTTGNPYIGTGNITLNYKTISNIVITGAGTLYTYSGTSVDSTVYSVTYAYNKK